MAEEDLIFGKNRHFFGGIEPSNMLEFDATIEDGVVTITATLPNDTIIDNQVLCTVDGAIIRRKTTDYPNDEFDGDLVANIKDSTVLIDSNASSTEKYYYAAFPYTTQGVYNRSRLNRTSIPNKKGTYLFGYDLVKSASDPSGRVTYPNDVDNANFTPASMNFSTNEFNYGGWAFNPGEKFMPRPCMLTYGGVVDHYLDPDNYNKKSDGTDSRIADISFGGNAMMEWPKIYTKRWEEDGVYHFRCSDAPQDSKWDCWCNYDRNDNQIDHFYTPIYFGVYDTDNEKLRSISGLNNGTSMTVSQRISLATNNGDGWYTEVLADILLIQDLLVMMAKSTDSQTAFGKGRGYNSSESPISETGSMNQQGMFWGANNYNNGLKVFGMENLWGNIWRSIAGWIYDNGTQKIKLTRGVHDGSTVTDYNTDGSGYLTVENSTISGTSGGYINEMKTENYGRLPVKTDGSSSTYESDALYYGTYSNIYYAHIGGNFEHALPLGIFCANLSLSNSYKNSDCGAALSCKPLAVT